jgi:hypothetical protein
MKHDFQSYKNAIFIESGSYVGAGIRAALNAGFERVISIELSEYYYIFCKETIHDERVELHLGDSLIKLPEILSTINEPCTFWLDGHYMSDPRTGCGLKAVPLMEELQIIALHPIKTHTILIDDMRLLRNHEAEWEDLPYSIDDIEKVIYRINPFYEISYDFGVVLDDILIAQI